MTSALVGGFLSYTIVGISAGVVMGAAMGVSTMGIAAGAIAGVAVAVAAIGAAMGMVVMEEEETLEEEQEADEPIVFTRKRTEGTG